LFRSRLAESSPVQVSSAGTHGVRGHGIDAPSAAALRELGVDPAGHVARVLDREIAGGADLVLTATTEHRDSVVELVAALAGRTFTLREFARLAGPVPASEDPENRPPGAAWLRSRVARIALERDHAGPVRRGLDNIADPYGATLSVARAVVGQISETVDTAFDALRLR
jgi:protein-tyrosine phosphatase